MLKISESIESITRLGKGGVRVGSDGNENGSHDDDGSRSGDFDRKSYPKLQYNSCATHLNIQD